MSGALTLVVGAGYTGRRVAARLKEAGEPVLCVTGSPESAAELDASSLAARAVDLDRADSLPAIPAEPLRILYLVPPAPGDDRPDPEPRLARFLTLLPRRPQRLVLTSTSGVYGDCGGELVSEERAPAPATERARRRVAQERTLERWAIENGVARVILRVSGIYGPGRLPLESIRDAQPVIREEEASPGNRIHVEDLVRVCLAALDPDRPGGIYNVADGSAISSGEFFRRIARIAGLPEPPSISREQARRDMSPMRYSFLAESRRLDIRRMLEDLGVALAYADPDAGIRASLAADEIG